ncbi:MAG: SBBP repeat-containing protein, partial [Thermodesulfobacteriota bacterium]|nr:SBBP repeat-containing protein [Thermodesulfobacteriota bacterium]
QTDPRVKFLARSRGCLVFLTPAEAVLSLVRPQKDSQPCSDTLRISLAEANPAPEITGQGRLPGKVNYFIGGDRQKWRAGLPTYAGVWCKSVYPGVDLVYHGNQQRLEYDFVIAPGGDPSVIRLLFKGMDKMSLDPEGNLILEFPGGTLVQPRPVVYQEDKGKRVLLSGRYELLGENRAGFVVAAYDRNKTLTIDPLLSYSTYLGGNANDEGQSVAVDASGHAYMTGRTLSSDFPLAGPYQNSSGGDWDAFVTKFDQTGESLVYSTYLGGGGTDEAYGMDVDSSGAAYITGYTNSADFPTANPFQGSSGGGDDVFAAKLNPQGNELLYSTYLGGGGADYGMGLALDSSGAAYITGYTSSAHFPTANSVQGVTGGSVDAFVTKLNSTGNGLVYSTYLGGSTDDRGRDIAVDTSGAAYVVGDTKFDDFPTTPSAYDETGDGDTAYYDAFVTKFNPPGTAHVYSTYLSSAGGNNDFAFAVAVDSSGAAYVTGYTNADDFPTINPFQGTPGGGNDAYLTKFNPSGSDLVFSTYLGGSVNDHGQGVALGPSDEVWVAGYTGSADFPTVDPVQGALSANSDFFVSEFNSSGDTLLFSTYMGGTGWDHGMDIAVHSSGDAFVAGYTDSADFPTATFSGHQGGSDAIVFKLDASLPWVDSTAPADGAANVPLDKVIAATFNEPMDANTFDTRTFLLTSGGDQVPGAVGYDADTMTASFTPSSGLTENTAYTATVTRDVTDKAGHRMDEDQTWSFTTGFTAGMPGEQTVTISPGSTAADYVIVSSPVHADSAHDMFGHQIGTYDSKQMRIGYWDAVNQTYAEYPFSGTIDPGWAGWFLFRQGLNLTLQGTHPQTRTGPLGGQGIYYHPLYPGWNQVGNPFTFAISVAGIVVDDGTYDPVHLTSRDNVITQRIFWVYHQGVYLAGSSLDTAQGGWVKKLTAGEGTIFFEALQADALPKDRAEPVPDDVERPPAPPGALDASSSSSGGGGGGGCFIGAAENR